MPDMDGREACKIMRRNGYKGPIIMLTAQGSDSDMILGLDAGANDYVGKPFRFGVLLARIRAHLRQHEQSEDAIFKVGPYTFKPSAKMLVTRRQQEDPADGEGNGDPEVPVPGRRPSGRARCAAA